MKPKVGAECLNWARSDLCGGRPAMGVPTAFKVHLSYACFPEQPSHTPLAGKHPRLPQVPYAAAGNWLQILCLEVRGACLQAAQILWHAGTIVAHRRVQCSLTIR